jgi:hypothetical protein
VAFNCDLTIAEAVARIAELQHDYVLTREMLSLS